MTQVNDQYLNHVDVKNPELLEILDQYAKLHTMEGFKENCHLTGVTTIQIRQRPYYVGEKYMQQVVNHNHTSRRVPRVSSCIQL